MITLNNVVLNNTESLTDGKGNKFLNSLRSSSKFAMHSFLPWSHRW